MEAEKQQDKTQKQQPAAAVAAHHDPAKDKNEENETTTTSRTTTTTCCPVFDTTRYNENAPVTWNEKLFLQERVRSFCYIPLTFGRATTRANAKIAKAGAGAGAGSMEKNPQDDALLLDDMSSPWGSNIYVSVSKPVPDAKMTTISGTFITKTFEGPYYKCGDWAQDTAKFVREKTGKDPLKIYAHYATCPKCAKIHGKNYVVMFAQIA